MPAFSISQPAETVLLPTMPIEQAPEQWQPYLAQMPAIDEHFSDEILNSLRELGLIHAIKQATTLNLTIPTSEALDHIFRLRHATAYQRILQLLIDEAQPISLTALYARTNCNINHLRKLNKLKSHSLSCR